MRIISDRLFPVFAVVGLIFLMMAVVMATQDRFTYHVGDEITVVTRKERPLVYWSLNTLWIVISAGCGFFATRRAKRLTKDEEA